MGMGSITTSILRKYYLSQVATGVSHVGPSPSHLYNVDSYSFDVCRWPDMLQAGSGLSFLHNVPIKRFCKQLGSQSHDLFIWNLPSTCCFWHKTGPRSNYGIRIIIEHNNNNFNKHLIGLLIYQELLLKLLSALEILTHLILQGVLGGKDESHPPFCRQES